MAICSTTASRINCSSIGEQLFLRELERLVGWFSDDGSQDWMGKDERRARGSGHGWAWFDVYVVLLKLVHVVKEVNYVNYEYHWLTRQVGGCRIGFRVTMVARGSAHM